MADDSPQDQGAKNFAMGIGTGQPADTTKPATSMQELMDQLIEQTGRWLKLVGVNVNNLKTSIFANLNIQEGAIKTGNSIVPASFVQGTQGGPLAGIFETVVKLETTGVSAPSIDAASGGDSGGGGGGGGDTGGGSTGYGNSFEGNPVNLAMADVFIGAGGGNTYNYNPKDVSESILGTLSPPNVGDMSMGRGEGMSMMS